MTENSVPARTATSDDEFDTLIEEATLPEMLVELCLHGDLRRQYEQVKARIDGRAAQRDAQRTADAAQQAGMLADTRLATKPPEDDADAADPEQGLLDDLVEQMRPKRIGILIRAMPSTQYNRLMAKHPPRRDPATGHVDQRDYRGFNAGTFYPDLVRQSIVRPTMTDERWNRLNDKLTDSQFDTLAGAAATVNRKDEDIPF